MQNIILHMFTLFDWQGFREILQCETKVKVLTNINVLLLSKILSQVMRKIKCFDSMKYKAGCHKSVPFRMKRKLKTARKKTVA